MSDHDPLAAHVISEHLKAKDEAVELRVGRATLDSIALLKSIENDIELPEYDSAQDDSEFIARARHGDIALDPAEQAAEDIDEEATKAVGVVNGFALRGASSDHSEIEFTMGRTLEDEELDSIRAEELLTYSCANGHEAYVRTHVGMDRNGTFDRPLPFREEDRAVLMEAIARLDSFTQTLKQEGTGNP